MKLFLFVLFPLRKELNKIYLWKFLIGTGLTATPEQADETCGVIRDVVADLYGREVAEELIIQYGGSMNDKNAAELLSKTNVDGGLIGGASLVAEKFNAIVDAAQ